MSDRAAQPELERIRKHFSNAYRARRFGESARIAAEGAALAQRLGDAATWVRMRVWEGESHWQNQDGEAARAALTEAAAEQPEADPADTVNALSTLLAIAVAERPLGEVRSLLARGRDYLARSGRQGSRHLFDLGEGDLAARRGDWQAALGHYRDAYAHQRGDSGLPRFTAASYLIKLAEASFRLGDSEALLHWCAALDETDKQVEGDRLRAEQARLLCYRAGLAEPPGARGDACGCARRVLCWLEEIEGYRGDYARDAMQVLLLHGDWLSVETWLEHPGLDGDPFLPGDLHLARARAGLGLPPRDPLWPGPPSASAAEPASPRQRAAAPDHLAAARAHYESRRDWAAREDARLETDAHAHALTARLQQIAALAR